MGKADPPHPDTQMLSAGAIFSQGLVSPVMGTNPDAPIKLGVNGFGRIGRQVVRIAMDRESMVLKHINSPMTPEYMKYLLEHDTVHGRFSGTCEVSGDGLTVNGMPISLSATRDPTEIPWAKVGVDYVCESTGAFTTTEGCMKHRGRRQARHHLCARQGRRDPDPGGWRQRGRVRVLDGRRVVRVVHHQRPRPDRQGRE